MISEGMSPLTSSDWVEVRLVLINMLSLKLIGRYQAPQCIFAKIIFMTL